MRSRWKRYPYRSATSRTASGAATTTAFRIPWMRAYRTAWAIGRGSATSSLENGTSRAPLSNTATGRIPSSGWERSVRTTSSTGTPSPRTTTRLPHHGAVPNRARAEARPAMTRARATSPPLTVTAIRSAPRSDPSAVATATVAKAAAVITTRARNSSAGAGGKSAYSEPAA